MTDDFGALRAQRAQLHRKIRELERSLGTEISTKQNFAERYGDEAPRRYADWRKDCLGMLHQLKAHDEALKAELDHLIRPDAAVKLYREVWEKLSDDPSSEEMRALRERVRVFVRDSYGIFFKDPKGDLDA